MEKKTHWKQLLNQLEWFVLEALVVDMSLSQLFATTDSSLELSLTIQTLL